MKQKILFIAVLTVVLFAGTIHNVSAESVKSETSLLEEVHNKEITDANRLLRIWVQLNFERVKGKMTDLSEQFFINETEDNYCFSVTQLLDRSVYQNDSMIRNFASSSFSVVNEDGELVTREEVLANTIHNGNSIEYFGNYNVAVKYTAYWQWYFDNSLNDYARCYKSSGQIVSTSSQYFITKFEHSFFENVDGINEIEDVVTTFSPTAYTVYEAFNPKTQFFNITLHFSRVDAGLRSTYNTGATAETSINIKQAVRNAEYFGY